MVVCAVRVFGGQKKGRISRTSPSLFSGVADNWKKAFQALDEDIENEIQDINQEFSNLRGKLLVEAENIPPKPRINLSTPRPSKKHQIEKAKNVTKKRSTPPKRLLPVLNWAKLKFKEFAASTTETTIEFPPQSPKTRWHLHRLAKSFNLNSFSIGEGSARRVIVSKSVENISEDDDESDDNNWEGKSHASKRISEDGKKNLKGKRAKKKEMRIQKSLKMRRRIEIERALEPIHTDSVSDFTDQMLPDWAYPHKTPRSKMSKFLPDGRRRAYFPQVDIERSKNPLLSMAESVGGKILQNMGWTKGKGLGVRQQGIKTYLRVPQIRPRGAGLGSIEECDPNRRLNLVIFPKPPPGKMTAEEYLTKKLEKQGFKVGDKRSKNVSFGDGFETNSSISKYIQENFEIKMMEDDGFFSLPPEAGSQMYGGISDDEDT